MTFFKIKKVKPVLLRQWGNPFEECQSQHQALTIAKQMKNMGFQVHIYKLSHVDSDYPYYKYYVYIRKA